jgi:hypothetical protein
MRRVAAGASAPLRSPLPGCGLARGVFQDGPARRWRAGLSIPCSSGPTALPAGDGRAASISERFIHARRCEPVQLNAAPGYGFARGGHHGMRGRRSRVGAPVPIAADGQSDLTVGRVLWITSRVASAPRLRPLMQPALSECGLAAQALAQREQPDVLCTPWPPPGPWARYSASNCSPRHNPPLRRK